MFVLADYPATCNPEDVFATYCKRREALFFVDVMARGSYPNYTKDIFNKKDVKLKVSEEDRNLIKKHTLDFISFSYYRSLPLVLVLKLIIWVGTNPYLKKTQWGAGIDPLGIRYCLNEIYDRYQKPLFVIENGMGAVDILENGKFMIITE